MHHGDQRPVTPQLQRRDGGRVLPADDEHVQAEEGMRLTVVVHDLGQFFAGNVEVVGAIVVSGSDDEFAGAIFTVMAVKIGGVHDKLIVAAFDFVHGLVLAHVELVVLGALAVVLQRFLARGLLVWAGKGNVADLQQLRRGEEGHVAGIVEEGIDQAAFVDVGYGESGAAGINPAGEAGRPGADDHHIERKTVQHFRALRSYLLLRASTPGSFLPSRNSSDAPPPVEMCVILSATPAAFTAATLSPPPTMETAAPFSATASAIFFVPLANASISNTPMGPFHTIVRAIAISLANSSTDFGPMSSAIMSWGIALPSPTF